jgi:hypothetical protein
MSLELLGVVGGIAVPVIGALIGIGKLFQRVSDHDRRITELEDDADKPCRSKGDE